MVRHTTTSTLYAPFYIHSFVFVQPRFIQDAEVLLDRHIEAAKFENVSGKLRYYRNRTGLLQKEVADLIGIERSTYSAYEGNKYDLYPIDEMEKLAELFNVPVTDLLDDYNLFLYNGQGKQIKAMRKAKGMTQLDFANFIHVRYNVLCRWELDKDRLLKSN